MPIHSVPIPAGIETVIANSDVTRTIIIFSNPDLTEPIYISDQPGVSTDGILIAPQMTVVLEMVGGWDTRRAHFGYCAATKNINVGENMMWVSPVVVNTSGGGGDGLPHPKDPAM